MIGTRGRALLAGVGALLFAGFIAACGSNATVTDDGALPTKPSTSTTATTEAPVTAQCTPEVLKRAIDPTVEDGKIQDQSCGLDYAIATFYFKNGPKAGKVGFFQSEGGGWKLLKDAATNSDVAAEAPPGFPPSLVDNWKNLYVDPTKTTTTTQAPSTTKKASTTTTTSKSSTTTAGSGTGAR